MVSNADPILIVSATVLLVPILRVFPAVPVPRLIVLALLPVPKLTVPVVPESRVIAEVVVEEIVPAPANVNPVAETVIVSIEATPVNAPPVVTFSPPFEVKAKVPVALPIAVFPVEEVLRLRVGAVIAAVPEDRVYVSPVSPVEEMAPEVDVRDNAPVVMVKPLEAVSVEAEVIVPLEVVEIFPDVESVPASVIVKVGEPPDWISIDVFVAPFVSLSMKAEAVPALVKVREVEVARPEDKVKARFLPVVVAMVFPPS